MVMARPVRALTILAGVLWCFFLYQVFKPSPALHGPGDRYINFERDPNLDRELPRHIVSHANSLIDLSYRRTRGDSETRIRKVCAGRRRHRTDKRHPPSAGEE